MKNKGVSREVLTIILLVVGLAIFAILYLLFASQGKSSLVDLGNLGLKFPWE